MHLIAMQMYRINPSHTNAENNTINGIGIKMYLISPSKVLKMPIHWDWDFVRDFFSHVVIYKSPNNLSRSIYQSKMHLTFTP